MGLGLEIWGVLLFRVWRVRLLIISFMPIAFIRLQGCSFLLILFGTIKSKVGRLFKWL